MPCTYRRRVAVLCSLTYAYLLYRCEEFAAKGCKVYATARRLEAMEGFTREGIERLKLDVTDDANVEDVVRTVLEQEGRIDVLVNNAAAPCIGESVAV